MRKLSCAAALVAFIFAGCNGGSQTVPGGAVPSVTGQNPVEPQVFETGASPRNWQSFQIPTVSTQTTSDFRGVVVGSDKNLWFADRQHISIDRVKMDGTVSIFPLTVKTELPWGLTRGPDGAVWFTTTGTHVGRVTTSGVVTEYQQTCGTYDGAIHGGPDGNVWFPDCAGNINRITPSGAITRFSVKGHQLKGMALGKDNRLWFSDITAHTIDAITLSGTIAAYPYHNLGGNFATETFLGPDGTIWFPECNAREYGKMSTSGAVSYVQTPLCITEPNSMAVGPDGAMWAAATTDTGAPALERITSAGRTFYNLPGSFPTRPNDIAAGSDGNLWFTGGYNYKLSVYIRDVITTTPSSITFTGVGQSVKLVISETSYTGSWSVTSSNTSVATVTPVATTPPNTYVVKSVGAGTASLTVSDTIGNSIKVPVKVP